MQCILPLFILSTLIALDSTILVKSNLCTVEQLPAQVKLRFSRVKLDDAASRKRKGKGKEGEDELRVGQLNVASQQNRLATLDIFAGCGGLSEGLQRSGNYLLSLLMCSFKWM